MKNPGKVYLVGAGPGDPRLITLGGLECIKKAQVIIYDRLINPLLLKHAPKEAEIIYAGKSPANHSLTQKQINRLLVLKSKKDGKRVVRLKGGDPFLFGRGAEEAMALAENNIPFEVIPGVSSAIAVAAYAAIPLTHRGYASSVGIFTGHEDPSKKTSGIDWEKISCGLGTLVFLMGIENLKKIAGKLLKFGRPEQTPCCLIQNGSLPRQKILIRPLKDIVKAAKELNFKPPAILIVGNVVALQKKLNPVKSRPLSGKTILITRPKDEDSRLRLLLQEEGARCLELPAIQIKGLNDYSQLDLILKHLKDFHWIVFSSKNAVRFFKKRLNKNRAAIDIFKKIKAAAIGPKTALALEASGIKPKLLPREFSQEGLLEAFSKIKIKGRRILLVNAAEARDVLRRGLERLRARVITCPAYRTVPNTSGLRELKGVLKGVSIITFTSSLAAVNFFSVFSKKELRALSSKFVIASIGPITTKKIMGFGLKPNIEAEEYTLEGLSRAITAYYKK